MGQGREGMPLGPKRGKTTLYVRFHYDLHNVGPFKMASLCPSMQGVVQLVCYAIMSLHKQVVQCSLYPALSESYVILVTIIEGLKDKKGYPPKYQCQQGF